MAKTKNAAAYPHHYLWLIILTGLWAYHNSFSGPFIFDDILSIPENPHIRSLWVLPQTLTAPPGTTVEARPLVGFSLALNFALSGLEVWSYHAVNLIIHILAALTLFGLSLRTLTGTSLKQRYGRPAAGLALSMALIWLAHPLQTESVTYIIQRTESLMGLLFLLSCYSISRASQTSRPGRWHAACLFFCALGMMTKEVMAACPVVLLLYDRLFLAKSWKEVFDKRRYFYLAMSGTWLILGMLILTSHRVEWVGTESRLTLWNYFALLHGKGISPLSSFDLSTELFKLGRYWLIQCEVILHYLKLCFWPHPLVLDYFYWPLQGKALLPSVIAVLALLGATAWGLRRASRLSFLGAWFFLILAPSSLAPLADPAFEHRMYLPLAAIAALCVLAGHDILRRLPQKWLRWRRHAEIGAVAAVVAALGLVTIRRNADYKSDISFWHDTLDNRPQNPRAHYNLAYALARHGLPDEAISHYQDAVRLYPGYVDARFQLAFLLDVQGRFSEAMSQYTRIIQLAPNYVNAYHNMAIDLAEQGKPAEAILYLEKAVRIQPENPELHNNLGVLLANQGKLDEAIGHYRQALKVNPEHAQARYNLTLALTKNNRP